MENRQNVRLPSLSHCLLERFNLFLICQGTLVAGGLKAKNQDEDCVEEDQAYCESGAVTEGPGQLYPEHNAHDNVDDGNEKQEKEPAVAHGNLEELVGVEKRNNGFPSCDSSLGEDFPHGHDGDHIEDEAHKPVGGGEGDQSGCHAGVISGISVIVHS